jgi:hypothetical protein
MLGEGLFPRSIDLGLIEGTAVIGVAILAVSFRDQSISASLKVPFFRDFGKILFPFRDQSISASLKAWPV